MKLLLHPYRFPKKHPAQVSESDDTATRTLVARLSRGNVLLQSGRYQTREQLDARAARMEQHRFYASSTDD